MGDLYLTIRWEEIDLVRFDKIEELKAAIGDRLHVDVTKVVIKHVDYLRDAADLEIFYNERPEKKIRKRRTSSNSQPADKKD